LQQELDHRSAASSLARSSERRQLESEAIARCLGQMIAQWRDRGDFVRVKVLELLLVKGWANRDVAAYLEVSEQQVANYRFAAVKKLSEHIRNAGLSPDVFPELHETSD
jgi:RNA polymerase sigma-70 factor (ECF subfamily)